MKDTYMLTANKGPRSATLPEKIIRVNSDAEMSTKDKLLDGKAEEITLTYDSADNQKETDNNNTQVEDKNVIYIKNFSDNAEEYAITENWRIKRYGDLILNHFSRVLKDTVVLTGYHGYGMTTTVMYVAKRIATGNCPSKFLDAKIFLLDSKNFQFANDSAEICVILYDILSWIRSQDVKKAIIFFDDFERMPMDFFKSFYTIIDGMAEALEFDMLKFLIGVKSDFLSALQEEFRIRFLKEATLINLECDKFIKDIIQNLRPKIALLSQAHSGITISDYFLEVYGIFAFASLGAYINYKSFLTGLDGLFAICENRGDKRISRKHIKEYYFSAFRDFEENTKARNLQIAKHEAGHTVLALALTEQAEVQGVMIVGDGDGAAGKTIAVYTDNHGDDLLTSREYVISRIAFNLAGREAQGVSDLTAHSDMKKAKEIAQNFLENIGEDLGKDYVFDLDTDKLSEKFKEQYEAKILALLAEGRAKAKEVLEKEKGTFDDIVEQLMKKAYLTGTELRKIWNKHHK